METEKILIKENEDNNLKYQDLLKPKKNGELTEEVENEATTTLEYFTE